MSPFFLPTVFSPTRAPWSWAWRMEIHALPTIDSRWHTSAPLSLQWPTLDEKGAAAAAKSLQSCPTLCDPIDSSPPGSTVPGILQARTIEWVAISFSNAWKWKWSRSVVSDSSWPHGLQPTRFLRPWDFPAKSTGVGCHCLWERRLPSKEHFVLLLLLVNR